MDTCDIVVKDGLFHLFNQNVSYIMQLKSERWLLHRYWGPGLDEYSGAAVSELVKRTFSTKVNDEDPLFSPDSQLLEFSAPHNGDYREASVSIQRWDGFPAVRFIFDGYQVYSGLSIPAGLPHVRPVEGSSEKTLVLRFREESTDVILHLIYSITGDSAAIVRSVRIENLGEEPVFVERALSALLDMQYEREELVSFHGAHLQEFQLDRRAIDHGVTSISSMRGASSPQYPPFAALCSTGATEHSGYVRAMQLIYSGNHCVSVERDQYDQLRATIGINPEEFSWKLAPGESFDTPQAVLIATDGGFNAMSREFHKLYTHRLFPRQWAERTRPILINSWEMNYFDVSEEKMLRVIHEASDLGFELVVLDDGWFAKRNNSRSSLGDWYVNKDKFPNDLTRLISVAEEEGIGFGIWFEPEMISPDSDLMHEHPDWAASYPGVEPLLSRTQLVLDLTRKDVQDYVINTLVQFLDRYPVSYVKWDMNRHMTDMGSAALKADRAGEFAHRYMLGLYRMAGEVTRRFPEVLFENCSSGGGRFDPGMCFYMPQTWCSDNSDALDRQKIQYGATYTFPPSSITAHISAIPNHQTGRNTPFATRANVACSVNMGYELNILDITRTEREEIQENIETYIIERDLVFHGEFYRLLSPYEGPICAWMLTDKDRERAIVYAFTPAFNPVQIPVILKIPYLDADRVYVDAVTGKTFSGSELKYSGLSFLFRKGDYPSRKIVLKDLNKS